VFQWALSFLADWLDGELSRRLSWLCALQHGEENVTFLFTPTKIEIARREVENLGRAQLKSSMLPPVNEALRQFYILRIGIKSFGMLEKEIFLIFGEICDWGSEGGDFMGVEGDTGLAGPGRCASPIRPLNIVQFIDLALKFPLVPHPEDGDTHYPNDQQSQEGDHVEEHSLPDPETYQGHNYCGDCENEGPERPQQKATRKVTPPLDLPPVEFETGA
jgi:hypothetical protein